MNRILGKLVCAAKRKHMRGKRVGFVDVGLVEFQCPRCGISWARKVRNVKPA